MITNIESLPELEVFDIDGLIRLMQDSMGVNPFTLYCQLTGKPIGRLDPNELQPFLKGDIEEVADDLFVRIIASMRPSIHWNVMRESSLADMAKSHPVETLAYLLNRLFAPSDFHKLPVAKRLEDQHQRIRLYQFLIDMQPEIRESLYGMLIEIDAKMNLSTQTINLRAIDFMLFLDDSLPIIDDFYAEMMKRWKRNQQNEEDSRRWYKGHTGAKPAFFQFFMETKPESKTATKKREKRQEDRALDLLLDSVMEEANNAPPLDSVPVTQTTVAKPANSVGKIPSFLIRSK